MGFKLVRIDSDEPKKIWLSDGTHLIGRGKFLECHDHRVSRNHGSLEVNNDSVSLTSLHHNPCFFRRQGTSELQILKQNDVTKLTVGDRLGLLPDIYWYEVIQSMNNSPDSFSSVDTQIDNEYSDTTVDDANKTNGDKTEVIIPANESAIPATQPESESLLDQQLNDLNENQSTSEKANTPSKRNYSSGDESNDVKKIKVEEDLNDDAEPGPSYVKKLKVEEDLRVETEVKKDDVKPEPNNDQPSGDQDSQKDNAPQSPTTPRQLLLERCMYGASCYRTNPQHKKQFCHPGDAAWGAGERGECPWGRGCRRRDPRHWRDHDHPPGIQPPPPPQQQQQGKKTVIRKKKREDDEDTPEQNLIVTGKRQRKTTTRQNWSGSESENDLDPFLTDGSDEWEPPTDSSQYTQDTLED